MAGESDTELLRTKLEPKLISKASSVLGISLGKNWRIIEGPYPNASSPVCMQFQARVGTDWKTVTSYSPISLSNHSIATVGSNLVGPWPFTGSFNVGHGGAVVVSWYITGALAAPGAIGFTVTIDGTLVDGASQNVNPAGTVPVVGYFSIGQGVYATGSHSIVFAQTVGTSSNADRLCYTIVEMPLV
jgi:hypothetical protein